MSAAQSTQRDIDALLGLITSATHNAVDAYGKSGHGLPSLNSSEPHPLDNVPPSVPLREALPTLEAACFQLVATLSPPSLTLANRGHVIRETSTTRVAPKARVTDALRNQPQGLHVSKISQKTGIESGKLARVMRVLAVKHIYREVEPDVFANDRLSLFMDSDHPMSSLLGHWLDECQVSEMGLYETLADPYAGPSYSPNDSSFARALQPGGPLFDWYATHPKESLRFGRAMIGQGPVSDAGVVVDGSTICDVGGGIGAVMMPLGKANPHLKLTIQDLPNVLEEGHAHWSNNYPEAIKEQRIDFIPIDFVKEAPVRGQDIYYARQVFHDWPDAECQKIIANIRKAMKPDSRLFMHDHILRKAKRDASATDQAPEPLLPTWGAGNIRPCTQDINMMTLLNAKERTLDEFVKLGTDVGLTFVKMWDFLETGMIEYALQQR